MHQIPFCVFSFFTLSHLELIFIILDYFSARDAHFKLLYMRAQYGDEKF